MGHSEKHIAPLVLGGIIAAGASLAGNVIGSASQNKVNDTNLQINRENNAFNAAEAKKQRNWQESMWNKNNEYNSPSAMVSRGLNPYIGSSVGAGVSKSPASVGANSTQLTKVPFTTTKTISDWMALAPSVLDDANIPWLYIVTGKQIGRAHV